MLKTRVSFIFFFYLQVQSCRLKLNAAPYCQGVCNALQATTIFHLHTGFKDCFFA